MRRYLRMYLPPSPADRDYRAGCLGAEVGHCFPCRDCDARFRHACKCCTAIHAITCRPVRRAQASAGLACCHTGWPFRGARIPTGRRAHVASLCPVANGPATGGRLGVAANLNNRTRQVALAGCGACCTIAVASSGVRPGIHCGTTGIPGGRAPVLWPLRCSGRAARWLARAQRKATVSRCEAAREAVAIEFGDGRH